MPQALIFDVFGTVVDWRGSITREIRSLANNKGIHLNAGQFANDWRSGYQPAMNRVRQGDLPWLNIDGLHRIILDDLKKKIWFRTSLRSRNRCVESLMAPTQTLARLSSWPETIEERLYHLTTI